MISKTLSPENQFSFRCPVFGAQAKIADCFKLRDLVWRGEGPPTVRQGCQCAMSASKCPVPNILTEMVRRHSEGYDPYHSTEPKIGKLKDDDLEKIAKVLVIDSTMRRFSLSPAEEKILLQRNEDARRHKTLAKPRREERVVDMDDVPATATTDAVVAAAASGDLSAAISTEE